MTSQTRGQQEKRGWPPSKVGATPPTPSQISKGQARNPPGHPRTTKRENGGRVGSDARAIMMVLGTPVDGSSSMPIEN